MTVPATGYMATDRQRNMVDDERPSMRDDGAWAYGPLLLPKRPEASAPSYLTPTLASHLWCLMPAKGLLGRRIWQRRYVLALRRRP